MADLLQREMDAVAAGDIGLAIVLHEAVGRLLGALADQGGGGAVADLAAVRAKRENAR